LRYGLAPAIGDTFSRVSKPSITAFFPCYNDANTIAELVLKADDELSRLTDDHEIIVVNDGSRDDSAEVLQSLLARVPRLRIVTHDVTAGTAPPCAAASRTRPRISCSTQTAMGSTTSASSRSSSCC